MKFEGKVVLVTGSSKGIGREVALGFAREGAKVAVNYNTSKEGAEDTARLISEMGGEAVVFKCDISKEDEVVQMVIGVVDAFGTIDILVNNAAIFDDSVIWKMDREKWERVLAVDLTGAFLCTKHAVPHMREKGAGRVIMISSVVGQTGNFGSSNYAAAKAGLYGLTKSLAKEVANKGITANIVTLGFIDIGMFRALPEGMPEELIKSVPMRRWGKPEEVVQTVLFLASEGAGYITGQSIAINGGYHM